MIVKMTMDYLTTPLIMYFQALWVLEKHTLILLLFIFDVVF